MERKTHILFTLSSIYWLKLLFEHLGVTNPIALIYILLVSSFPLISIPFMANTTTFSDADHPKNVFKRTILFPAIWLLWLFVSHRWATHDIRWISIVGLLLFILYLLWPNIIVLWIIAFLFITLTYVVIEDVWPFKIKHLVTWLFSWIILVYWPVLLDVNTYNCFLISLFFSYVWHMLWDAITKEGWKIIKFPFKILWFSSIKFQLPSFLSFTVGGPIEKYLLQPGLLMLLMFVLFTDRSFFINKSLNDLTLVKNEYVYLYNNPKVILSDYNSVNTKLQSIKDGVMILWEDSKKIKEKIDNLKV